VPGHWRKITALASLTLAPGGRLGEQFQLQRHNVNWWDAVWYVHALRRRFRRPLIVVWDRLEAHRKAARLLWRLGAQWVRFRWLPTYAPELNPVESLWSNTKYAELANWVPADDAAHQAAVARSLVRPRHRQRLLRSFFQAAGLKVPLFFYSRRRR
jgi:hypothetical protein